MIQRIQTVYLFVGSAVCALPFLLGFAPLDPAAPEWVETMRTLFLALATGLGLASIFLFANRKRQLSVVFWAQIVAVLGCIIVVATIVLYGSGGPGVKAMAANSKSVIAWAAPLAAGLLYFGARRAISSDIDLVKSMDRLRD